MTKNKILPFSELTAVTPLDGRYREKVAELSPFVSEYALIRTRVEVEAKYLLALSDIGIVRKFTEQERKRLLSFSDEMSFEDVEKVKQIEKETRHDVKAMERTFRTMLKGSSLEDQVEMIHFGLTSEDVNNLSYRLMLKRATQNVCIPQIGNLIDELVERSDKFKAVPMLARTHGQAAIPTTVGKELSVFAIRINKQTKELEKQKLTGKLLGAVGNLNALQLAYPEIDWITFAEKFVSSLGFEPNLSTTQINPYDDVISYFQNIQRINNIIIDFNQDMWRYISDNWFIQEFKKGEVGSSTMPQKVNPIDFENSEGNLGMANGILEFLSRKLAISRLQRDLSDSTVIRNIGTVLGFSLVGYKSVMTGLSRVRPNEDEILNALNKDYSILTEGVQTVLRKEGADDPYSLIASLSKGKHIGEKEWNLWINDLPVKEQIKKTLAKLKPTSYIGFAIVLTEKAIAEIKSSKS